MVLETIKNRQSVREFKDEMPSDEAIEAVLEAARLAPSWINTQPWHFIVVTKEESRKLLCKLSHGQPHVKNAPVVIVCCGNLGDWEYENFKATLESNPRITPEKLEQIISNSALNPRLLDQNTVLMRTLEQVTYANAYMTIEAHNQGLGTCVVGGIGNELTKSIPAMYKVVKEELNIPKNFCIMSLMPLGYPSTDQPADKIRKTKDSIVSYETY